MVIKLPIYDANKIIQLGSAQNIIAALSSIWNNPIVVQRIYPTIASVLANQKLAAKDVQDIFQVTLEAAQSQFKLMPAEKKALDQFKEYLILALLNN